jgi:hypothetical protein
LWNTIAATLRVDHQDIHPDRSTRTVTLQFRVICACHTIPGGGLRRDLTLGLALTATGLEPVVLSAS